MNNALIGLRFVLALFFLGATYLTTPSQAQQPESPVSCDEGNGPLALVYGDHTTDCEIDPATDLDRFEFCGLTGDSVRLNTISANNLMDPTIEIRDPNNAVIIDGVADGATCNDSCAFTLDLILPSDGCYTVFLSDAINNNTGGYSLQVERIAPGPGSAVHVNYDEAQSDAIDPATDIDYFTFNGTAGTDIRLNVLSASNLMDPTVEMRDPNGELVLNGAVDGAACSDSCSFSVDVSPTVSGTYSLLIYDGATNNTGGYDLSLWCLAGPCDSNADGTPDTKGPLISYVTERADAISPAVDADFYTFNATAGTDLRLNVLSAGNLMDPTVEIRDPGGTLVLDGVADGATCNDSCSFSADLSPASSGTYTLIIYDRVTNNPGGFDLGLWCLAGPCDSDADGLLDGNPPVSFDTPAVLQYGVAAADAINPGVDSDIFIFGGTSGDLIRFNVLSAGNLMDPTIEIRDPNNAVIIDGVADGATCNDSCSFTMDLTPALTGTYSLLIFDRVTNNTGGYEVSVQCLVGQCTDAIAMCADNCIDYPNGPADPDDGGNVQLDTDMDGYGNGCDADLNNDDVVNPQDLGLFRAVFLTSDPDADFNGDGIVNPQDLGFMRALFLDPPGPSCRLPDNR